MYPAVQHYPLIWFHIAFKSFKDMGFTGIFTSQWIISKFAQVFRSSQFLPMIKNTLGINLIGQTISILVTIGFALLLNEIRSVKMKSLVQTVTYMQHFLSWVVFGGLCINILSPNGGIVNLILMGLKIIEKPIIFLAEPQYFWAIAIVTALTKDLGLGWFCYLAAIAGINGTL